MSACLIAGYVSAGLAAPAGAGVSTLVVSCARVRAPRAAWRVNDSRVDDTRQDLRHPCQLRVKEILDTHVFIKRRKVNRHAAANDRARAHCATGERGKPRDESQRDDERPAVPQIHDELSASDMCRRGEGPVYRGGGPKSALAERRMPALQHCVIVFLQDTSYVGSLRRIEPATVGLVQRHEPPFRGCSTLANVDVRRLLRRFAQKENR